ncbi:right-handed parallel beta-helix repeat-containing protein, partial [Bartonella bovis]
MIEVDGGMIVLGDGVKKVEGSGSGGSKGVLMGGTEKLVMMRNVTFEGVTEGININGGKGTGLSVMGMGGTTMTVNGKNDGVVGIKVEDMKAIDATVMRLKIVGSGTGSKGVEFIGKGGTLMLNMVEISGFETGVEATAGTLKMMGGTAITVTSGGTGLSVSGKANAELMRTKIVGSGKGTGVYGVKMMGSGTVEMTSVGISGVKMGVYATNGRLEMMGTTITVKEGGTGVEVKDTASATLMGGTIMGEGGKGMYGVKMMGGTVEMTSVDVSGVKMGVYVGDGTVVMNGESKITITSGAGYGVGVGVSGGAVTMMGTKIVGTSGGTEKGKGTGVYMGSGTVTMDMVEIEGFEKGVSVEKGKLVMKGGWIKGMGGKGVVMGSGTVMMDRVWISNVAMGVEAMGTGTLKMMGNSAIIFTGGEGSYGVKVGGTATAHLTDVKIRGMGGQGTGKYGVIMEGGTVTMNMVGIEGVKTGVSVEKGKLVMKGGWIKGEGGKGTGVYATGTGTVLMSGVWIEGGGKGVEVSGKGMLEMMGNSTIIFAGDYGVKVGGTASAILMRTTIVGSGKGMGMYATGTGKMLMMSDVRISGVGMGVDATKGNLVMHKGSVEFKGNYGIYLIRGNALLNDITITGPGDKSTGTGMYVGSSGKIVMKDVTMSRVGTGVEVTNGGAMWLGGTHLKNVQNGMIVTQGSTVGMEGGEITFKGSYGVYLDKGGAALKDVKMTYKGRNDAVDFMTVQGGKVIAKDIQIYGNGKGQGMKVTQRG